MKYRSKLSGMTEEERAAYRKECLKVIYQRRKLGIKKPKLSDEEKLANRRKRQLEYYYSHKEEYAARQKARRARMKDDIK